MIAAPLRRAAAMALTLLTLPFADVAFAGDPTGTWLTEGGKSRVRISQCGGAICGNIVWLKEPNDDGGKPLTDQFNVDHSKRNRPIIGIGIVLSMKPSKTPDKWTGQVYSPEEGKAFSGSVTVTSATTVKVEGCALGGVVCRSQTWTRVN